MCIELVKVIELSSEQISDLLWELFFPYLNILLRTNDEPNINFSPTYFQPIIL